MDNSTLSRLPLELRENVMEYVLNDKIIEHSKRTNDCGEWRVDRYPPEPAKSIVSALSRCTALIATCRELQDLGVRTYLRSMQFTWSCSLFPPDARAQTTSRYKTANTVLFCSLPSIQMQGYIASVGGVGAVTTDNYLHREQWSVNEGPRAQRYPNWGDNPLDVLTMYKEAAYISSLLRKHQQDRGLEHRQMFFQHSYRLQAFTDGNALRPIKKALRGTWKRDTMDVMINMLDEAKSLRHLEVAQKSLDAQHHERIEAIQREIKKEDNLPMKGDLLDGSNDPRFVQFLCDMDWKYGLWTARIKKFHTGLIKVVMLAYRMDYRDVDDLLAKLQAELPNDLSQKFHAAEMVVDAVVAKLEALRPFEIEPKYQIKSGCWLNAQV